MRELEQEVARLKVLEPEIGAGGPMGRIVLVGMVGMVAEMELGFIRDRQRAGIDAAKAKGVHKDRPPTFDRARIVALGKEGMGLRNRQDRRVQTGECLQGAQGRWAQVG